MSDTIGGWKDRLRVAEARLDRLETYRARLVWWQSRNGAASNLGVVVDLTNKDILVAQQEVDLLRSRVITYVDWFNEMSLTRSPDTTV